MREIKFRAWHKKKHKMLYNVQKTEMVHHAMSSMAVKKPKWYIMQCLVWQENRLV